MKKYNGFQLKLFMALLMVLDHISLVPGLVPPMGSEIFHLLTRCVGVWFGFLAVEGFLHTRSRIRYNGRLFFWAALMEGGNILLNYLFRSEGIVISNNIFLTLAFGVLALNLLAYQRRDLEQDTQIKKNLRVALKAAAIVTAVFGGMFFTEGGMVMIPFILLTYLFRNYEKIRNVSYIAFGVLLFFTSFTVYTGDPVMTVRMLMVNSDWAFVSVIPLICLYNGERGRSGRFAKYFFYIFYPVHLWLLGTLAFLVAGGI